MTISRSPSKTELAIAALASTAVLVLASAPAAAEAGDDARRLAAAIDGLAPYDLAGGSAGAMGELAELSRSLDPEVATTARFLRAAATVDLLAYGAVTGDSSMAGALAKVQGVAPTTLRRTVAGDLARLAKSSLGAQARATRVVLSCLGDRPWESCAPDLRRVAASDGSGATAARLLLVDRAVRAAEAARDLPPAEAAAAVVAVSGALCAETRDPALVRACRELSQDDAATATPVAVAVLAQAVADLVRLERAVEEGGPLAVLATAWTRRATARMGHVVLLGPITSGVVPGVRLPEARGEPAAPPLVLLVAGRESVAVAFAPATVVAPEGTRRLDEAAGLTLPGRKVLSLPGNFRAVIRPIPELTAALVEARGVIDELVATMGDRAPGWVQSDRDRLGLAVDRGVTLVDLARFVASAQQAGYQSFALFGARADGRLAWVPMEVGGGGSRAPAGAVPRITVGPSSVALAGAPSFQRQTELDALGRAAAQQLEESAGLFAVEGRPMMPYGVVFPAIDAVASAAPPGSARCLLALPR